MSGTLDELKSLYRPGKENTADVTEHSLLADAIGDNDPARRCAKANFLLDDGADPTWRHPYYGFGLLHILFGKARKVAPITDGDVALMGRLLEGGADPNAIDRRTGTALQALLEQALLFSEASVEGCYDILFQRDGLDLFDHVSRTHTLYGLAHRERSLVPNFWEHTERYIQTHHLVVPSDPENDQEDDDSGT